MIVINFKDVSCDRSPWSLWYFYVTLLCLSIFGLIIKDMLSSFSLLLLQQHSSWCSILTHMVAFLFFLYAHIIDVLLIYCLILSNRGMIILLPLMEIPSMIAISSLNDQEGCSSFYTSVFVDGQLWSMSSAKALKCWSSRVASLISSAVIHLVCLGMILLH